MARDLADDQVALPNGPTPQTHLVTHLDGVIPKAVSATFDGSGAAGAFLPTLIIAGKEGREVARIPAPEVAAGASAEVSWFPRVAGAAAKKGLPSLPTAFFNLTGGLLLSTWGGIFTGVPWTLFTTNEPSVFSWPGAGSATKVHIATPGVYRFVYEYQVQALNFPVSGRQILSTVFVSVAGATSETMSLDAVTGALYRGDPSFGNPWGPVRERVFNIVAPQDVRLFVAYTGPGSVTLATIVGFLYRIGDEVF